MSQNCYSQIHVLACMVSQSSGDFQQCTYMYEPTTALISIGHPMSNRSQIQASENFLTLGLYMKFVYTHTD